MSDAVQIRLSSLKESEAAIEGKIAEARSYGVEQRELEAMIWCLNAVRDLIPAWAQRPDVIAETAIPEDWVMVPREPTEAMLAAAIPMADGDPPYDAKKLAAAALLRLSGADNIPNEGDVVVHAAQIVVDYRAMIAAAPEANIQPFRPYVLENAEAGIAEMHLENCPTITGQPMTVRPLLRMSDRSIVGFQWDIPYGPLSDGGEDE